LAAFNANTAAPRLASSALLQIDSVGDCRASGDQVISLFDDVTFFYLHVRDSTMSLLEMVANQALTLDRFIEPDAPPVQS
jgi:hypothetical protein